MVTRLIDPYQSTTTPSADGMTKTSLRVDFLDLIPKHAIFTAIELTASSSFENYDLVSGVLSSTEIT